MSQPESSIGILTTDADLVVRSWDDWLVRATGISAQEARGQPLVALVPDLEARGLLARFEQVLRQGAVQVLATAFHHYLIPCPPQMPSRTFERMQQRVTIAPLREDEAIVGILVTIEDVTARQERERQLAGQLQSPDEATRLQAARALAEEEVEGAGQGLAGALGDESWRVRQVAVRGLVQRGEADAVAALLRALRDERHSLSVLNSALQVLAMSDLDVVSPLVEFLREPEADLRTYAALALGERRDPRAIPALLAALDDPDANVRFHAIEALGRLRAREAVAALTAIAETRDFFLAFPALDALALIGDPQVAPGIVPLLADELMRTAAIDALGQLGDEQIVVPLADLLNRPGAPTLAITQALAGLYERYEAQYAEGEHIADLTRQALDATGQRNLLDALADTRDEELPALARVLGWLEGAAVESALTRLLGQPSARSEVVQALVRHGTRVIDLLIEQTDAQDPATREAAVIALGRIGDARAVPALAHALTEYPDLLIVTAGALAKIGDRRAFEPLLALLGHPQAACRQAVVSALNSIGHPDMAQRLAPLLDAPDPLVRESAVKIAGYFGYPDCVDQLFARCQDANERVCQAAIDSLPNLEDARVQPALFAALASDRPKVRASAARALGQVHGREVFAHLIAALRDENIWVRYYAAHSLGQIAFPEALEALANLAHGDEPPMVRASAIGALSQIGGPRAVSVVAPLIEAEEPDISHAAFAALGQIGHPDALPPLLAAMRSPDPETRLAAIRAVAQRDGPGAAGALQWIAATDSQPQVAQAAMAALARLATPQAVAALVALTADPTRREACVAALAGLGQEQANDVARGLSHVHPAVRQATVNALARMKNPRASALLSAALEDEQAAVRLEAVLALRRLGSPFAERSLARLAHSDPDPAVRDAARAALPR